ncbi:MAG: AraC family transcriptional regulator, partial [Massilia sp.]
MDEAITDATGEAGNVSMDALRAIAMSAGDAWTATGLPRVAMMRAEACSNQVYGPMLHLVLQGSKSLSIGGQVVHIEAPGYFVVPVALPALGQITAQSGTAPYLAVSLALDPAIIAAMLADLPAAGKVAHGADVGVAQAGPDLIDAWLRMMQLVARPDDVAMMAPLIEREILFRVLQGPHGDVLRQIAHADSRLSQVRRAIDWIRDHMAQPLRVGPLAALAGMSVAAFYRHFRAVTAMTPIQYQKSLRLLKARRLLLF